MAVLVEEPSEDWATAYPVEWCGVGKHIRVVVGGAQVQFVASVAASGVAVLGGGVEDPAQVGSPVMRSRWVHSRRTEAIQRSANAFIRGACGAVGTTAMPIEAQTASNAVVNFASWNQVGDRFPTSSRSAARSRAGHAGAQRGRRGT